MSIWSPDWRIIVDGVNLTDVTLTGLTITTGRTNVYNQPQAGYCAIQLINTNGTFYDITVNSSVTIEIKNSSNNYIALFGGKVSDVTNTVNSSGSSAVVTRLDILAIGSISKLYKAIYEDSLAQDDDGNQIYAILSQLLLNSWNEVAAGEQWATYDPTQTWANAQDIGLGDIDVPGQYEMIQRSASPTDYYSLVTQIATSALGYIYENANGDIGYADAAHRQNYLIANGYVELDAGNALNQGIKTTIANGNLVNKYILNYGNNFNNQETALDQDSIDQYGLYAANIYSNIHDATDAQSVAERQVQLRAYPRPLFDSITFALQNPEIDDADRDALLNVFMGLPVRIVNLPITMNGGEFTGYVEGWTFRATVNGLTLSLTVSPTEFSAVAQTWAQVNAAESWNSILNTLEWQDAIGVIS
jgi:hypothetical protein